MTGIGPATPDLTISGAYRVLVTKRPMNEGTLEGVCDRQQPQLRYRLQQAGWPGQQAALVDLHGPGPVSGPDSRIVTYDPTYDGWAFNGDVAVAGSFMGALGTRGGNSDNEGLCVVGTS